MSHFLLLLIVAIFGVFVYLMCFKASIIYPLLIPILILLILWYVITFLVTKKMVDKKREGESLLFLRGQLIDKITGSVTYGALTVTSSELVFYKRKSWKGGIDVIWSAFVPSVESYELKKVDGKHNGIELSIKGETHPVFIATNAIRKKEEEFRALLGWHDEAIVNTINES